LVVRPLEEILLLMFEDKHHPPFLELDASELL
jgi:hypothetical protein